MVWMGRCPVGLVVARTSLVVGRSREGEAEAAVEAAESCVPVDLHPHLQSPV